MTDLHAPILEWYDAHARDLPWRRPDASAWSVMVSELMLQQTPVARVLPVHEAWLERWPTPAALAAEPTGEAVRAWGRLGYPRRALRLHAAAVAIVERHGGEVPASYDELIALPGRRRLHRGGGGQLRLRPPARRARHQRAPGAGAGGAGRGVPGRVGDPRRARPGRRRCCPRTRPPPPPGRSPSWSSAPSSAPPRDPRCDACPVADRCAWRAAGHPAYDGPPRRGQAWAGTDRQCRGRMMAVLREADGTVRPAAIEAVWPGAEQRDRCLAGLVDDGLVAVVDGGYALPG